MEHPFESNSSSSPVTKTLSHADNEASYEAEEQQPHKESFLAEIIKFSLVALLIVLPVRIFVAQPFIVSGASMEATFSTGQYLIVDQLTYHFEEPQRGDVIVFRYPKDPSKFFIKRIIGIPGDIVDIKGNVVTLSNDSHPEGIVLDESYILAMAPNTILKEKLGVQEYFVMGDNRDASSDSRMWGVLPRENIVGRAFLRLFPFPKVGIFPGNYDINGELTSSSK